MSHTSTVEPSDDRHDSRTGIGRRALLRGGALAAPAVALTGLTSATPAAAVATQFDPTSWDSIREQFVLNQRYAHFSAFMLASHPRTVRDAIAELRHHLDTFPQRYHMGVADLELSARCRAALARYTGADPDHIALTDSATMGIGLVYAGLRLRAGDEVVTTPHDFYSTYEALRLRRAADGVVVREVPLYDNPADASVEEIVQRLRAALTDRTRVIALTWVHSSTGVKLPVRQIAGAVAEVNATRDEADRILVCLDGVHGFAAEDVDVAALGVDFFMTSTHKWLFGPRGTGFVWGNSAAWQRLRPTLPSFSLPAFIGWFTGQPPMGPPGELHTPGGYHSFEHRWALPAAVEFHEAIGRSRIAVRTREQATQLKEGLKSLPHVRLITPMSPEVSSGIVCCAVDGMQADQVAARLTEHRISAGATPYRESFVRFGPSIVTNPTEVDRAVAALAALR